MEINSEEGSNSQSHQCRWTMKGLRRLQSSFPRPRLAAGSCCRVTLWQISGMPFSASESQAGDKERERSTRNGIHQLLLLLSSQGGSNAFAFSKLNPDFGQRSGERLLSFGTAVQKVMMQHRECPPHFLNLTNGTLHPGTIDTTYCQGDTLHLLAQWGKQSLKWNAHQR